VSTDVSQISVCLNEFNEIWSRAIEFAIALPLLTRQLGWVSIVPLVIVIGKQIPESEHLLYSYQVGPFYGAALVAKHMPERQKTWADATQRRLAVTSSMLRDMDGLKMMGLNEVVGETVQNERILETNKRNRWVWMVVWQNAIGGYQPSLVRLLLTRTANSPSVMVPAVTFSVYAIQAYLQGTESLDTVQAFTSLALISLLTVPTSKLLAAVPSAASSIGCFDRIQNHLLSKSRVDGRVVLPKNLASNGLSSSQDEDIPDNPAKTLMVEIENASFRPATNAEIVLSGVNLQIRPGTIVMITGPVGAGKTTLLKAIIGDIPPNMGAVYVKTRRMGKFISMAIHPLFYTSLKCVVCPLVVWVYFKCCSFSEDP